MSNKRRSDTEGTCKVVEEVVDETRGADGARELVVGGAGAMEAFEVMGTLGTFEDGGCLTVIVKRGGPDGVAAVVDEEGIPDDATPVVNKGRRAFKGPRAICLAPESVSFFFSSHVHSKLRWPIALLRATRVS